MATRREATRRQTSMINAVKRRCGNFGNIALPYWIAHVKSVTPDGVMVDQEGVLVQRAPGATLRTL
jgi:hypothetical protein